MKLVVINGNVPYMMKSNNDHVYGEMPLEAAERIIASGKKSASSLFEGFPICIDNKFLFAASNEKSAKSSGKKEVASKE